MSEWISVKDRLPQLGRLVIVSDGCCVMFGHLEEECMCAETFHLESSDGLTTRMTHWHQLPKPPKKYTSDGRTIYYKGAPMSSQYIAQLLNILSCKIDDMAAEGGRQVKTERANVR